MRGRKPKPTALKVLHGRPGHRRVNDAEPIPPGKLDTPPPWLSAEQKASWQYALAHAPPGLLRRLDRGLLIVWVVAEDTHRRAAILLQGSQTLLMRAKGVPAPFPSLYIGIMSRQALIMIKAASELGFSPASRARVYASGPPPPLPDPPAPGRRPGKQDDSMTLDQYVSSAPPRPRMH